MRLIVGLGNPGEKYRETRHNIGFRIVESLAAKFRVDLKREKFSSRFGEGEIAGRKTVLLLPQTFMNRSGDSVVETLHFYKVEPQEMMVVHDDIDFPLGKIKLDFDAGAAGHNGVLSIIDRIGTKQFFRVRAGVGRPHGQEGVENYVLSPFLPEETEEVKAMAERGLQTIEEWINKEEA